jgi:hypothetical protein
MPRYNWNIVESGVKHHKINKQTKQLENTSNMNYRDSNSWYTLSIFVMW